MDFVVEMIAKFSKPPKFWNQPRSRKKAMPTTSVQSIWLLLLDDTLWNPIARCTRCKNLRYARIAWEILRRNFIQSTLSTNWSPKKRPGCDHRVALCLTKWFSHFSQFFGHYVNPKYLMLVGRWGTLVPPFCRQQPPWVLPFCRCPHTIL